MHQTIKSYWLLSGALKAQMVNTLLASVDGLYQEGKPFDILYKTEDIADGIVPNRRGDREENEPRTSSSQVESKVAA